MAVAEELERLSQLFAEQCSSDAGQFDPGVDRNAWN